MNIHHLKTWPEYYREIIEGSKTFELRVNDRGFEIGDILHLEEYDPQTKQYTGRSTWRRVGFMIQGQFGLADNVCCMSLLPSLPYGVGTGG